MKMTKLTPEIESRIKEMLDENKTYREITSELKVTNNLVAEVKKKYYPGSGSSDEKLVKEPLKKSGKKTVKKKLTKHVTQPESVQEQKSENVIEIEQGFIMNCIRALHSVNINAHRQNSIYRDTIVHMMLQKDFIRNTHE